MAVSYLSRLVILREIAARLGKDRPAASTKPRVFIIPSVFGLNPGRKPTG